jgi:hypothetical protein
MVDEERNLKKVCVVLRNIDHALCTGHPEVPAAESACGKAEEAREGMVESGN